MNDNPLKELANQVSSSKALLLILLSAAEPQELRRARDMIQNLLASGAAGEAEGPAAAALHDALRTVSLFCDSGDHPPDPGKLFRLIRGGKKE